WQGLVRAGIALLKTGEKKQGGSTITMQVARNFFLSREKTYLRKLNEIFLAFKIERNLSKDEILELYLNKIYLGQRAYGIAAAAQIYYGAELFELELPQIAMLAGLPKAPSTTNPITNPEAAKQRRQYVLERMLHVGFINAEEFKVASEAPLTASLHATDVELDAPYVAEMVRKDLIELYGEEVYTSGLNVYTTLIDRNQTAANHALRKALLEYDERHGYRGPEQHIELNPSMAEADWGKLLAEYSVVNGLYPALVVQIAEKSISVYMTGIGVIDVEWAGLSWARKYITENRRGAAPKKAEDILRTGDIIRIVEDAEDNWRLSQIPSVEGGLISLNPENGASLALVGGFDFYYSKFNRVTQAFRQPGSGFKPFIYSAALAAGETAASIFNDAPVVFSDPGIEDEWRPENYGHDYKGPMRMREALTQSRNLVSIRLLNKIGVPFALDHVARFGFDTDRLPKNLSLALGSGEISLWEQARAYSVFANGRFMIEPYYINYIVDAHGETIFEARPKLICRDCLEEPSADEFVETLAAADDAITETGDPDASAAVTETEAVSETGTPEIQYAERVVDARNIWIMNSITRDVIQFGTGRRALVLGRKDLSGKTGTTNDQRDAWFSGFNSNVVAITWVGFDKFLPLGSRETGARAALPMWIEYMKVALEDRQEATVERPEGLVNVRINSATGKPARANDPDAVFEVFRNEFAPATLPESTVQNPYSDSAANTVPDLF
ncbi:MAG: PBP1A family penicillin-binding protein, partial [Thiotrichales bacterium]|nr:PBP1A family penicillin-binding protein [Thiotrichales bacterium]